jgi:menaquinol-cytochrome c reductase iron-sulfur subunit
VTNHSTTGANPNSPERRTFFNSFAALVTGGLVGLFPFAAGLGVLLDPLRKKSNGGGTEGDKKFIPVCPLEQLPADGVPRRFSLVADVVDAWSRLPAQPFGAVYLVRAEAAEGEAPKLTAFTTTCPHLGCAVEFQSAAGQFECPCHTSGFAVDGRQIFGPSRRGLDTLEVKTEPHAGQAYIWVAYQRFRTGIPQKEPIA